MWVVVLLRVHFLGCRFVLSVSTGCFGAVGVKETRRRSFASLFGLYELLQSHLLILITEEVELTADKHISENHLCVVDVAVAVAVWTLSDKCTHDVLATESCAKGADGIVTRATIVFSSLTARAFMAWSTACSVWPASVPPALRVRSLWSCSSQH